MKYIKELNIDFNNWDNINKIIIDNEKFPKWKYINKSNPYIIYDNNQKYKYLNKWFYGIYDKQNNIILIDELWTVKKMDTETSHRLYDININPILLSINYSNTKKYYMICKIYSVDDSSFTIWFINENVNILYTKRYELSIWLDNQKIINGEEFLNKCIELGADESQISYN
jgi:hypothetical protein